MCFLAMNCITKYLNDDGSITYQHLKFVADTTIGNERPSIIVRTNQIYDKGCHTEVTHEYVFERDGKGFWWNKTSEEFTILYDFRANVGDEWDIKVGNETITVHVDAIDENCEYNNRYYRMLFISDANDFFSGAIICGIGHLTSFFPEKLMARSRSFRVDGMRCFWRNGFLVFKYGEKDCDEVFEQYHHGVVEADTTDGFRVYPNPTNGLLHVVVVETFHETSLPSEYRITNLMGQTLLSGAMLSGASSRTIPIDVSSLPAGMYFITCGNQTAKFIKQ
jgi:hypothetical protein